MYEILIFGCMNRVSCLSICTRWLQDFVEQMIYQETNYDSIHSDQQSPSRFQCLYHLNVLTRFTLVN